jgi:hypothetical protein
MVFMAGYKDVGRYPGNNYFRFMAVRMVDPSGAAGNRVVIQSNTAVDTATGYVTLALGQCAVLGVDLVIDVNAPYCSGLAAYQNNIEEVLQL